MPRVIPAAAALKRETPSEWLDSAQVKASSENMRNTIAGVSVNIMPADTPAVGTVVSSAAAKPGVTRLGDCQALRSTTRHSTHADPNKRAKLNKRMKGNEKPITRVTRS